MDKKVTNKYVAFLRGIKVGGHKKMSMAELKTMLSNQGYGEVKTLLNSGNAVFTTNTEPAGITTKIVQGIEQAFGFKAGVIVRSFEQIQLLISSNPFRGIAVTPATRLYVSFLSEKPNIGLEIPAPSADNFTIIRVTDTEVCSVLTLTPDSRSVDAMAVLEREFGKKITIRNWNTLKKIVAL